MQKLLPLLLFYSAACSAGYYYGQGYSGHDPTGILIGALLIIGISLFIVPIVGNYLVSKFAWDQGITLLFLSAAQALIIYQCWKERVLWVPILSEGAIVFYSYKQSQKK